MEIGAPAALNNITNFVKEDDDPAITDDHNDQYYHDLVNLPPGFRFHPTDEEIITHYLTQKVIKPSFTASAIGHVDLNKSEPWDLPQKAKMGEKEWFFFCQRDRKYPTGMRTNRATDSGYWKATGKDREIYKHGRLGCLVGMKKTLVFYKGRAPKGEKTNWVMHEFRLHGKFSYYNFPNPSKDEWVVCKVFHKNTSTAGIKRSISTDDHLQVMTTFVDGFLDSPCPSSSLPPLVDAHAPQPQPAGYYKRPSSCFTNYKDNDISGGDDHKSKFKGSTVITSDDAENSYLSYMSYNLNSTNFSVDKHNTVPYSPQLTLPNYHHDQAGGAKGIQPQQGIIGRGFKVEHYLLPSSTSNNRNQYSTSCGMISHSQDTGLSTAHDMNSEISSSVGAATSGISSCNKSNYDDPDPDHDHHHVPGGLVGAPSLSYLDSFWEY